MTPQVYKKISERISRFEWLFLVICCVGIGFFIYFVILMQGSHPLPFEAISPALVITSLTLTVLSGYLSSVASFQRPPVIFNNRLGLTFYSRYLYCNRERETKQLNIMFYCATILCVVSAFLVLSWLGS